MHETNTDDLARKHSHDSLEARITPPSTLQERDSQDLFRDPTMAPSVDFQSQEGFTQVAKKKAKAAAKAAAKNKWEDDDEDGSKKDEGEGSNNGGDKDGDTGTGAGGDDEKKDDANGDGAGDANPDDEWSSFTPAKSKKKGKKGKVEDAAPALQAVEKFDAFHEIKLDDTGPMLDLSFDTGTTGTKSSGFGAWGSSWNTGTTKWVFSLQRTVTSIFGATLS